MEDRLSELVDIAMQHSCNYTDCRFVKDEYELIEAKNGSPSRVSNSNRFGIGIRVLFNGAWGFASTNKLEKVALLKSLETAIKIAKVTAENTKVRKALSNERSYEDTYTTPHKIDPFSIDPSEKIEPLTEGTKLLAEQDSRIRNATATLLSRKYFTELTTSEGTHILQSLIQCGASLTGMLMAGPGGMSIRTSENYKAQGYEFIDEFDLDEQASIVGSDLKILADKAVKAPSGTYNLILEPSHLGLAIHESVGHPTELDRVLGREADFAGTSFLTPSHLKGGFKYGSELVNIVQDPTLTPALGTYAYDDDGTKSRRLYVIENGEFNAFQSDRSTANEIGSSRSSGNNRAHGHDRLPINRMANLYLEPNTKYALSSLDELLEEAKTGVYALYSRTHSISPNRSNFQFTTQMGYLIEDGELTTPLKNVVYGSRTLDFWRNCLATTKSVEIFGTPNCGKGNPGQTIWTSHGGSHTLFGDIRIGA